MLLEAKQQISHLGDTENIALYVRMLQIAKEALIGSFFPFHSSPSNENISQK
jgi:hypothetical protein